MSDTTTRGIRVQVTSIYLPERSSPRDCQYLLPTTSASRTSGRKQHSSSRANGSSQAPTEVERVKGPGVVGEQPVLTPARLRIHELLSAENVRRVDAGQLPDDDG